MGGEGYLSLCPFPTHLQAAQQTKPTSWNFLLALRTLRHPAASTPAMFLHFLCLGTGSDAQASAKHILTQQAFETSPSLRDGVYVALDFGGREW